MSRISPRRRAQTPEGRRRLARAAQLWGGLTLSGTSLVAALAVWHLIRRGRLIRSGAEPPRPIAPLAVPPTEPR